MPDPRPQNQPILAIHNLVKSFGALLAINRVELEIRPQRISAIIGPNGAGKSTLFNLITGRLAPDQGQVFFEGQEITRYPPHLVTKLGIGRSFQISNVFLGLSVFANIRVGILSSQKKTLRFLRSVYRYPDIHRETMAILKEVGLDDKADIPASMLSQGDLKCLEFGLALACRPKILLLDEPTAGMNPMETTTTVNLIKKICLERGLTIFFTEHDMDVVFSISDYIYVLHQGSILAEGRPEEIKVNPEVKKAYLGEDT
jgi:branched-chain amino acid transport system ATP-binding protein